MESYCFNCGCIGHSIYHCSEPVIGNGATFAKCFICNEKGHLSKNCPKNEHGIYINGGSCRLCGKNDHLIKNCPLNKKIEENDSKIKSSEILKESSRLINESGDAVVEEFKVKEYINSDEVKNNDGVESDDNVLKKVKRKREQLKELMKFEVDHKINNNNKRKYRRKY